VAVLAFLIGEEPVEVANIPEKHIDVKRAK
jgi:hypothetical protein